MYRRIYVVAEMLLIFMMSVVLLATLLLMCGISIHSINFFIPVIFVIFYRIKFFHERRKNLGNDLIIFFMILFFTVVASGIVYDHTWDGCAYHKTAVGLLKEGWNPIRMSADKYNSITNSIQPARDNPLLWTEIYPKATWYFASIIYYVTGNIEAGKCYTLIFAFITFGVCIDFFKKRDLGNKECFILAAVAAINPVVCYQFQTYYLDGVVASVLTILIIKFLGFLYEPGEINKQEQQLSVFALLIWGCNLKFNIPLYIATICAIYCICLSFRDKKVKVKDTLILILEGIISIFGVGFAPYITNIERYGNIFGSFGSLLDEKAFQMSFGIDGLSGVGRFWTSVFGRTSHGQYHTFKDVLKVPFTFKVEEFIYYTIPDAKVGGLGVMFSGLFIFSTLIILIVFINRIKQKVFRLPVLYVFLIWSVSLIEFCLIPQTSQFRYVPHLYLCVLLALYFILKNKKRFKLICIAEMIYIVVVIINILPWGGVTAYRIYESINTSSTLKELKKKCEADNTIYQVSFYEDDFTGIFFNLKDYSIKYKYIDIADADPNSEVTYTKWLMYKNIEN